MRQPGTGKVISSRGDPGRCGGRAAWHAALLHALGYLPEPLHLELASEGRSLPALLRLNRHGRPSPAVLQSPFRLSDGEQAEEPLGTAVRAVEASDGADAEPDAAAEPAGAISRRIASRSGVLL